MSILLLIIWCSKWFQGYCKIFFRFLGLFKILIVFIQAVCFIIQALDLIGSSNYQYLCKLKR